MKYDYALIESYIHERGHALDAFFKSAGISTSLFNQWKKGEKIPKHNQIELIARKLKVDTQSLVVSDRVNRDDIEFDVAAAFDALQSSGLVVKRRKETAALHVDTSAPQVEEHPVQKVTPPQPNFSASPTREKSFEKIVAKEQAKQSALSRYSVVCPKCKKLLPTEKRTVVVEKKDAKVIKTGYCGACKRFYTDDDSLRYKDVLMGDYRIYWSNLRCKSVNKNKVEFIDKAQSTANPTTKKKQGQHEHANAVAKKQIEQEKRHLEHLYPSSKAQNSDPDFQIDDALIQLPVLENTSNSCPFCKKSFSRMIPIKYLVFSRAHNAEQRFTYARACNHCQAVFLDQVQFQQVRHQAYNREIHTLDPSKFSSASAMMEACRQMPQQNPVHHTNIPQLPFGSQREKIENISAESKIVQVYANKCHCAKCHEKYQQNTITNRTAVVETTRGNLVNVNVMFCMGCGQYFINIKSLEQYKKMYGGLLFECKLSNDLVKGQFSWFDFAPDSILSRCGYTVKEGVTKEYRQAILRYILETGKAQKYEIIELISSFIDWRSGRPQYENACNRWREDIHYVSHYQIQNQKKVYNLKFSQAGKIRGN